MSQPSSDGDASGLRRRQSVRRATSAPPHRTAEVRRYLRGRMDGFRRLLCLVAVAVLLAALGAGLYLRTLAADLPSLEQLENPAFQLAAVAYTADGQELARYSSENRSWTPYERISTHVVRALVAIEDHRFYRHGGIDLFRTLSAAGQSALASLGFSAFEVQGGSTITQQLARNLYNQEIGFDRSLGRKLKEMMTARELEKRYDKREILELYLNTVQFGYDAYGIDTGARTFFGKPAVALTLAESATLVGMLKAITRFNPVRNPERSRERRDLVLRIMAERGFIAQAAYEVARNEPVAAAYHSSAITRGPAPHFAQMLREWLTAWGAHHGVDVLTAGLRIRTTIDGRLQALAEQAVAEQMDGLQAVVDYEWSRAADFYLSGLLSDYLRASGYEPFAYFWESRRNLADAFAAETSAYARLRLRGLSRSDALAELWRDPAFTDSLKAAKTRLEAGLVSIDPSTGAIRVWVGGRDMERDWNDHVAGTRRQPGSAFKPFVYTAAVDNGFPPSYTLPDRRFTYTGPFTNAPWSPRNFGGASGAMVTLRRALATSNNVVTARVITELVTPPQVAFYARRMGVESPLEPVASLGLGTSDVTLLELAAAYATLAGGGRYFRPQFVTRIEDREGRVLFEADAAPERHAISSETAFTVVDMLRGAVEYGTAVRLRGQFGLGAYDLAAKTGTTQNGADGWFVLMHPELVTAAWVGFNDPRVTFRSNFWGQGAHNALFLVGTFFRSAVDEPSTLIGNVHFPGSTEYGLVGGSSGSRRPRPMHVR